MSGSKGVGAWMKVYVDDFFGGTADMTTTEIGAYWLLLLHGWDHGGLPRSASRLAVIARMPVDEFRGVWSAVGAKFTNHPTDPDRLVNEKQEEVRAHQEAILEQRRKAGRRGAARRWPDGKRDGNCHSKRDSKRDSKQHGKTMEGPRSQDPGLREEGTGTRTRQETSAIAPGGARAAGKSKRRDGKLELSSAVDAWEASHGPMRSDLIEALEEYRQERVSIRAPIWDRSKWAKNLDAGKGDQESLIRALQQASRSGWRSVHPKPSGVNGRPPSREEESLAAIARFRARLERDPT